MRRSNLVAGLKVVVYFLLFVLCIAVIVGDAMASKNKVTCINYGTDIQICKSTNGYVVVCQLTEDRSKTICTGSDGKTTSIVNW